MPKGELSGRAAWYCQRTGDLVGFYPSSPDLTDCRHLWVGRIESAIVARRPWVEMSRDLNQNLVQSGDSLVGGDVTGSLDIMKRLLSLARSQSAAATRQTADDSESEVDLSKMAEQFTQVSWARF